MKITIVAAPVLALVLFYVISQQRYIDTQIQKQDAVFERDWAEFQAEFSGSTPEIQERIAKQEQRIQELEEEEKGKEKDTEEFYRKFKKQIKNIKEEVKNGKRSN